MRLFQINKSNVIISAAFSLVSASLCLWKFGLGLNAAVCFLIFFVLMLISIIDIKHRIIPDRLLVVLAVFSIIWAFLCRDVVIIHRLIGIFILSVPMLALTLFITDAFGGGDIKLIAVCGFLLGFKLSLLTGFVAIILGGFHGFFSKYIKKNKDAHISFGQYICFGAFVSVLFGDLIIWWYFNVI